MSSEQVSGVLSIFQKFSEGMTEAGRTDAMTAKWAREAFDRGWLPPGHPKTVDAMNRFGPGGGGSLEHARAMSRNWLSPDGSQLCPLPV